MSVILIFKKNEIGNANFVSEWDETEMAQNWNEPNRMRVEYNEKKMNTIHKVYCDSWNKHQAWTAWDANIYITKSIKMA